MLIISLSTSNLALSTAGHIRLICVIRGFFLFITFSFTPYTFNRLPLCGEISLVFLPVFGFLSFKRCTKHDGQCTDLVS